MTTRYEPPLGGGHLDDRHVSEALTEGPEFGRTARATRWHRVRSGYLWLAEYDPDTVHEVYSFWCGQHATSRGKSPAMLADTLPPDEPLCGTCEGRALGADDSRPDLLFTPRGLAAPKVCPGSHRGFYVQDQESWRRGTCLVCRDVVKLRVYGSGPYGGGSFGPQRHPPGPGLVPGCPFHAWRYLRRSADDTVTCSCTT